MTSPGGARWSGSWAKAWSTTARGVAADLRETWQLVGKGGRSRFVRTPVRWWLSSAGFSAASGGRGHLYAAHQPLTVPWHPEITFEQQEFEGDGAPRPDFEPWEDDAADVLRWWLKGPAGEHFDERSDEEWLQLREKTFELSRDQRVPKWPMLAGFRIIMDAGPATPVIDAVLERIDQGQYYDEDRPWWEDFRTVAASSEREQQLQWLDDKRREVLAQVGVPDSAIVDVLAEES